MIGGNTGWEIYTFVTEKCIKNWMGFGWHPVAVCGITPKLNCIVNYIFLYQLQILEHNLFRHGALYFIPNLIKTYLVKYVFYIKYNKISYTTIIYSKFKLPNFFYFHFYNDFNFCNNLLIVFFKRGPILGLYQKHSWMITILTLNSALLKSIFKGEGAVLVHWRDETRTQSAGRMGLF